MAANKLTKKDLRAAVNAVEANGSITAAAIALGIPRPTLQNRVNAARREGLIPSKPDPVDNKPALVRQVSMLEAELRKALKESAEAGAIKAIIGGLGERIEELEPPEWLTAPLARASSPGVPLLFLSDFHWGEVVHPTQINGVNTYNLAIAKRRLHNTVDTALHLLKIVDDRLDYPGIVVPLGGDMISGNIHEELTASNEINSMPAVLDLYGELVSAIGRLADVFGAVLVPCVTGNHGRDTRKIWGKIAITLVSTGFSTAFLPSILRAISESPSSSPIAQMLFSESSAPDSISLTAISFEEAIRSSDPSDP